MWRSPSLRQPEWPPHKRLRVTSSLKNDRRQRRHRSQPTLRTTRAGLQSVSSTVSRRTPLSSDHGIGSENPCGSVRRPGWAFLQLAADSSAGFRARLEVATDRATACAAVIDIIANQIWAEPRTLLLSYELYAFAARHPAVGAVMQQWMDSSRDALGRFFDPLTARALDALIEGIGIHNSIDRAPLDRDAVTIIVERIAGC